MVDADTGERGPQGLSLASNEVPKPKFKTNKVNSLFGQSSTPSGESASPESEGGAAPATGSATPAAPTAAKASVKTMSSSQRGRFTLGAIKDHEVPRSATPGAWYKTGDESTGDAAKPDPSLHKTSTGERSDSGASGVESHDTQSTESASASSGKEATEEELTTKGIHIAGRFHSSSNMNWEDEEEDWNPQAAPSVAPKPTGAGSAPAAAAPTTADAAKPAATPAATPAAPASDAAPWGQRKIAVKSLNEQIKEAKEHGSTAPVIRAGRTGSLASRSIGMGAPPHLGSSSGGGSDALGRFRIGGGAALRAGGRGPPPLNPRDLHGDEEEDGRFTFDHAGYGGSSSRYGPLDDFNMFANRRPLATPHEPPRANLGSGPPVQPRPTPDRFKLKHPSGEALALAQAGLARAAPAPKAAPESASTDSTASVAAAAAPSSSRTSVVSSAEPKSSADAGAPHGEPVRTAPAVETKPTDASDAASEPKVAASTPAPATPAADVAPAEPEKSGRIEQQKNEMREILAAVKARRDAELKREADRQAILAEKREQMRKELEAKAAAEKAKIAEAKAAAEAKRRERAAEMEARLLEHRARQEKLRAEREQEAERERAEKQQQRENAQRERAAAAAAAAPPSGPDSDAHWDAAKKKKKPTVAGNSQGHGSDHYGERTADRGSYDIRKAPSDFRKDGRDSTRAKWDLAVPVAPLTSTYSRSLPTQPRSYARGSSGSGPGGVNGVSNGGGVRVRLPPSTSSCSGGFDVAEMLGGDRIVYPSTTTRGPRTDRAGSSLADLRPRSIRLPGGERVDLGAGDSSRSRRRGPGSAPPRRSKFRQTAVA